MMVRNGEDIHLSMTNHLECNRARDSVVPIKKPKSKILNLGRDSVASFNKPGHMENRAILIRSWVTVGYQPMKMIPLPRISEEMRQFYLSRLRYWTVSLATRSASRSVTHATLQEMVFPIVPL